MDSAPGSLQLNRRALAVLEEALRDHPRLRITVSSPDGAGRFVDAGVRAEGGIEAGILLARLCLAGLGSVSVAAGNLPFPGSHRVDVAVDHPVAACMASQYAGWQISLEGFFGMGSGPMRAAYGGEDLFGRIGLVEKEDEVLGVLETASPPGPEVFRFIAGKIGIDPARVTLVAARTRSIAGGVQVVARSVETALHKLDTLGFDLTRVRSGLGAAPLPPPAKDDLRAMGRTNDAILYGGQVTLLVRGDDDSIREIGPRVPSSASPDHGSPFREIFERNGKDFYRIDPALFSPAEVSFWNIETGRTHRFGRVEPSVLERSFHE